MAFGVTADMVAQYAKRPFVQQALAQPFNPKAVLSFFTGINFYEDGNEGNKEALRKGTYVQEMSQYWYAGGETFDELCQPFGSAIQKLTSPECIGDPIWQSTVDGKVAQLILADQLSRNCFRGTDQAFAFDEVALQTARDLVLSQKVPGSQEDHKVQLVGEFYGSYWTFVATSLMHSEAAKDHEMCMDVLNHAKDACSDLNEWWDSQRGFELDHKKVIDQFGRYPHRNKKKGRSNTKEEEDWLKDVDNLPGWAKSQL